PALERGEIVLCDRFELSTRAYQGYGRGVPQETIVRLTAEATDGILPDLYLLLDVPPSVGRGRQGCAAPDRIEREGMDFMERVRAGYAALAASDPSVEAVDASGAPDRVEAEIAAIVERRFPGLLRDSSGETFAGGPGLRH
ncbi:MAG: dTMP kinase, partial [Gemmatimonadota bacterium]|nr:dTMP kinase [Gemmatimonadota bacterium]